MDKEFYDIVKQIESEKRAAELAYKETPEYRIKKLCTYYYVFCRCSGVQSYRNVYGNFLEFLKSDIYSFICKDCNFNIVPEKITKENFVKTQFVERIKLDFFNIQQAKEQRIMDMQEICTEDLRKRELLNENTVLPTQKQAHSIFSKIITVLKKRKKTVINSFTLDGVKTSLIVGR